MSEAYKIRCSNCMKTINEGDQVTSEVMLDDKLKFKLKTFVLDGEITTYAVCCILVDGVDRHRQYHDYAETLEVTYPKRATDDMVAEQHERHVKSFDAYKEQAMQSYEREQDANN